jgi:hypothetical protein
LCANIIQEHHDQWSVIHYSNRTKRGKGGKGTCQCIHIKTSSLII